MEAAFYLLSFLLTISVTSSQSDVPVITLDNNSAFAKSTSIILPSAIVKNEQQQPCQPKHIHLATGPEPWNSMMVSFSTSCKPKKTFAFVEYGVNPFELNDMVYADPRKYMTRYNHTHRDKETGEEIFYASDYIYHVPLTGLKENQLYFYRCNVEVIGGEEDMVIDQRLTSAEDEVIDLRSFDEPSTDPGLVENYGTSLSLKRKLKETNIKNLRGSQSNTRLSIPTIHSTSSLFQFTTAPLPGQTKNIDGDPIKFAIVGDLGQTYNSSLTMYHMLLEAEGIPVHTPSHQSKASLAICAGDMSYADSDQSRWDNWFELISPLTSRIPFMVTPGNHEIECDIVTHKPFMAFENRFAMPRIKNVRDGSTKHCKDNRDDLTDHDYGNSYYAFTYGMARIIVANPYSNSTKHSYQYNYILQELQTVDRSVTPWLFVIFHCPFYNTFKAHVNEPQTLLMQEALEPLFVTYKVNLVLTGHTHGYMRSKNVAFGNLEKHGPVYLIVGEGGNREQHVKRYLKEEPEEWVAVRDKKEYGFGTVELLNATHVRWRWVRSDDLDVAGVKDDCLIENQLFAGMD